MQGMRKTFFSVKKYHSPKNLSYSCYSGETVWRCSSRKNELFCNNADCLGEITRSKSVDELVTPQNKTADVDAEEPTGLSGTDLSTLFLAEALKDKHKIDILSNESMLDLTMMPRSTRIRERY